MSNWWLKWAEQIALFLAEQWTRTRSGDVGGPNPPVTEPNAAPTDKSLNPNADSPNTPTEPNANAPH